MYTREQVKKALDLYRECGSVTMTIRRLGYPSRTMLYQWAEDERKADNPREVRGRKSRHTKQIFSTDEKIEALKRCFEKNEPVELVAREIGCSKVTIYNWRNKYLRKGFTALMPQNRKSKNTEALPNDTISSKEVEDLKKQMYELQMEVDILKETINVLKKDPGVDWKNLKNKEKVAVIDAMKERYPLPDLLSKMEIARSSYYYQIKALRREDKYRWLRVEIVRTFKNNKKRYGYRRIYGELRKIGIEVSEKVVRRIMKEEHLEVKTRKAKKYNSYKGEISPAVSNEVKRNFHSKRPEELLLTDLTEFSIPAGKVYLSPMMDCFDGMLIAWRISEHPNADLVNGMLDDVIARMNNDSKPIIHTDRGCHYRWPGWIERMETNGYTRSMSQKGCSPDNAACEGLFGRIKNEFFYNRDWSNVTIEEFIYELDLYLHWYNEKRSKKSLGYLSPMEYRRSLGLAI